jgi:multimeric flavodoxin WrbA
MEKSPHIIKVLGISGSPRDGNSRYLLKEALMAAQNVDPKRIVIDEYSFRGKKFSPCIACFRCDGDEKVKRGECVIKDDFQTLRDKWVGADVIIYSVPVYHVGIPGQLKCFIDRLGNTLGKYYNVASPRHLKVIGAIAQGQCFGAGQELAIAFLIHHAVLRKCIPISGDGWESYIGGCGWTQKDGGEDAIKKLYESGQLDGAVAVKSSRSIGKRAAELALILKEGGSHLKEFLSQDPCYTPFVEKI